MFEPVKVGIGEFLQGFYREVVPTTKALQEFRQRGFAQCVALAPARMVDQVAGMLDAWQRNDSAQAPTRPPKLPAMVVAVTKDYTPASRDFTTQIADPVDISIPSDGKQRYFQLKLVAGELRAQLAIMASDEATAKSLAAQFLLYLDSPANRSFSARYPFAGIDHPFPAQIEAPDNPAMSIESGAKNVTLLAIDLTLRVSVPLFMAPGEGEPNDGLGVPGTDDPAGYPLVDVVGTAAKEVRR